jgi:hypothetical protein
VTTGDYVCVDLATENLELLERVRASEVYRDLAKQAIEELHRRHVEIETLRRLNAGLRADLRALRGQEAA